jgi:ABC-type sugar transport systems, permease components
MGFDAPETFILKGVFILEFIAKRKFIFFLLPGFILYTMFMVYPILYAMPSSLTKWSGIGPKEFVGVQNYITLFTHPVLSTNFFGSLLHTFTFILMSILIIIPITFLFAYMLFRTIPGHKFFEVVIFSPQFVNVVTVGFMVTLFFDPYIGIYSSFMKIIGLGGMGAFPWYSDPKYSVQLVVLVSAWRGIGYNMLLFIANLRMVPEELEEAAYIDGANEIGRIWYIYIPLMAPSITNIVVLTYIGGISAVEIPYVLGGSTGGVGHAMDFLGLFFYRTAFSGGTVDNPIGMGTTIAVCMFFMLLIGSVIQTLLMRKMETEY